MDHKCPDCQRGTLKQTELQLLTDTISGAEFIQRRFTCKFCHNVIYARLGLPGHTTWGEGWQWIAQATLFGRET